MNIYWYRDGNRAILRRFFYEKKMNKEIRQIRFA